MAIVEQVDGRVGIRKEDISSVFRELERWYKDFYNFDEEEVNEVYEENDDLKDLYKDADTLKLVALLNDMHWGVQFDDDGNINDIFFDPPFIDSEPDDMFLKNIAPWIVSGSFIEYECNGEPDTRYEFNTGTMKVLFPRVTKTVEWVELPKEQEKPKLVFDDKWRNELVCDIETIMCEGISDDYVGTILHIHDDAGVTVLDDIIEDVLTSSGWSEGERWNDDDIRLSIGRVLIDRLQ